MNDEPSPSRSGQWRALALGFRATVREYLTLPVIVSACAILFTAGSQWSNLLLLSKFSGLRTQVANLGTEVKKVADSNLQARLDERTKAQATAIASLDTRLTTLEADVAHAGKVAGENPQPKGKKVK